MEFKARFYRFEFVSLYELTFDFANCWQIETAWDVIPLANVSVYVDTILVSDVVRLSPVPILVAQFRACFVRYKRSLRRHVSAVDI